jgi:hypothetical protein
LLPVSPLLAHTGNYEASAVIRQGDFRAEAEIARLSPASYHLCFTEPGHLAGMTFTYRQDGITVEYSGLSFPFDAQSIPTGAIAEVITSALSRSIEQNSVTTEHTETGAVLSGEIDAGSFRLGLELGTNQPRKLFVPTEELEIEFTDFIFLD